MKIKPVFVGIVIIGVLLLVLSLSAIAKVFAASPRDLLAGVNTQPQAVRLLPQRSPLFISFLVKPEKLGLFAQLAAKPSDRRDVRHDLANLQQQLRQNWLLDYERDIQPWLDQEITLAVTDPDLDHQAANGLQTGYLLAFAAKDVELAKTTIDAFWQRLAVNGSDLGFEQYQGISILSTGFSEDQPAIAGMTLDKFVLFANDVRVLHKAIDDWKSPDLALTSLKDYGDRLTQINTGKNTGKFGIAYVNFAELDASLPQASMLLSLGFDKSGIRVKTLWNSQQNPQSSTTNIPPKSTAKSPANSHLSNQNIATAIPLGNSVIVGKNLNTTLQNLKSSLPTEWQNLISEAIAPLSLNTLNSEALAWAQNEFAIALSPNPHNNPDWLIVAKVNDAETSEKAIAVLDDLAKTKLTIGDITLKSQPVKIWTKLSVNINNKVNNKNSAESNTAISGTVVAAHAQTPNYIYLSNSLTSLKSALTLKTNQSIAASKNFKKTIATLPSYYQTYGYIDQNFAFKSDLKLDLSWLQTNLNIETAQIWEKLSNSSLASILTHLDIISIASIGKIENTENGEIFLSLK